MSLDRRQSTNHSSLTPNFCFSTSKLKEFLQLSRSILDDSISQNLDALSTPSRREFNPRSTSQRPTPRDRLLPSIACRNFVEKTLLPSWQTRTAVLEYCASVASSADPEDPDSLLRVAENTAGKQRIVDERLDPYSGRFFPKPSRTEVLAQVVRNERMVEDILRERTWRMVRERCGDPGTPSGDDWRKVMDEWGKRAAQK